MEEKTIQRIKKLQALAERGVGGEKETAAKMLQRLLEKNGISTLEELEKDEAEYFLFSYKAQTLKDFESGKVLVFILADFLAMVKNPMMQDDVALRGVIAHEPIYRTTPRGKRITDISVMVKNELTGNKCFVPCICWQEQADKVAGWQQGDTVELLGRYQSRQYEKVIDTDSGSRERRTAYEISVQLINRKERAENES